MDISLVLIVLFVIVGILFVPNDSPRIRRNCIVFYSLAIMLVLALRHILVGADTITYDYIYSQIAEQDWDSILSGVISTFTRSDSGDVEDVGYVFLMKVISYVTSDFHLFTFIALILFFYPFGKLIDRYSTNLYQVTFAYVFFAFLLMGVAMLGARQIYAIGLCILAWMSFVDNEKWKTVGYIALASTIHFSSLIVVLPMALSYLNEGAIRKAHILSLIAFPVVYMMPNVFIRFLGAMARSDKYQAYGQAEVQGGANTFVVTLLVTSLFCLYSIKREDLEQSRFLKYLYCMVPCFTLLGPLINSNGTMIRLSMYFHLYLALLIPIGLEKIADRQFYQVLFLGIILISIAISNPSYYFFWETPPVFL